MSGPRVIVFDLETAPDMIEAFKVWPQLSRDYGQTFKAQVQSVLVFGWRVVGSTEGGTICVWDFPDWQNINDDLRVLEAARGILETADALVTQNGKRFDFPFLQTRLLKRGLEPLDKQTAHVDTKTVMSGNLSLISNSLENAGRYLLGEGKMENGGWDLWVKVVLERDPASMQLMRDYCAKDVELTERLYLKLRPLSKGPNHNLFSPMKEKSCPHCGSSRLKSEGKRYTQTKAYRRYICMDCHGWSRTDLKDEVPRG